MHEFRKSSRPWIIALTGASGTIYGRRLLHALVSHIPEIKLEVILSDAALRVMREEDELKVSTTNLTIKELIGFDAPGVTIHNNKNIGATIASGSYLTAGMVVVPCSMRTLAAISNGLCENLIHRAADVVIKEGRKLIIVPRETPLSAIHLENMLKLSKMGVGMIPAMPGFYNQPKTISDLVDGLILKIIDQMGFEIDIAKRWGSEGDNRWRAIRSV